MRQGRKQTTKLVSPSQKFEKVKSLNVCQNDEDKTLSCKLKIKYSYMTDNEKNKKKINLDQINNYVNGHKNNNLIKGSYTFQYKI